MKYKVMILLGLISVAFLGYFIGNIFPISKQPTTINEGDTINFIDNRTIIIDNRTINIDNRTIIYEIDNRTIIYNNRTRWRPYWWRKC